MVNHLVNNLDDLWDISFSFSLPSLILIKKRYWSVLILERRIIEICYWPFLILGEKRKRIAEGGKAGRANDKTANPPQGKKESVTFTTEESITFQYFPGFCFGKFLRNRWWLFLLPSWLAIYYSGWRQRFRFRWELCPRVPWWLVV